MTEQIDVSEVTIDVTQTTEEINETIEQLNESNKHITPRNMFYANDAMQPPPENASIEDKIKYKEILKSVKRLRKLEKNPVFRIKQLDLKTAINQEKYDN